MNRDTKGRAALNRAMKNRDQRWRRAMEFTAPRRSSRPNRLAMPRTQAHHRQHSRYPCIDAQATHQTAALKCQGIAWAQFIALEQDKDVGDLEVFVQQARHRSSLPGVQRPS